MAVKRQSAKALRLFHSMSLTDHVRALPHPAFRWLYGVTMEWNGHNNGAIVFTESRHGKKYGIAGKAVFATARDRVLATGLVTMVPGGRNRPAFYALANEVLQVDVVALLKRTRIAPSGGAITVAPRDGAIPPRDCPAPRGKLPRPAGQPYKERARAFFTSDVRAPTDASESADSREVA